MPKKKADKGGVEGSGLYRLGAKLNATELARFGLKCRKPGDGIMALPYADKRSANVGDWFVSVDSGVPQTHAFRLLVDATGRTAEGIRAARLVRTKRTVTYTIIPDNAT